jgi:3-hydroxyacyl-CoA dehydrogenase / enoyl-CoA hydratase / 3-hydroxybutyryl-CoA epimerase / enoyl-CoA isomerase
MSSPLPAAGAAAEPAFRLDTGPDQIAVLTFDLPGSRANTMGRPVLAELGKIIAELGKRTDLRGLILRSGKPGMFIAGADLRELGSKPDPAQAKAITQKGHDLMLAAEALPFPTAAAIDGSCMGGGLELSMSLDYRLTGSNPKAELGLPEVKIGIYPGWGGTQRLPRLIGPSLALEMICSGDPVNPVKARSMGLIFDVVASEKLVDECKRVLAWSLASGDWKKVRLKKQQPIGLTDEQLTFTFAVARAQVAAKTQGQYPAPVAAVEAVAKGCNLPLTEGLKVETEGFMPLAGSVISRNLISVFFMTQRLQKDPGVANAAVQHKTIERVGVIGAGLMGAGIAGAHVIRGVPATLLDSVPAALQKGVFNIGKVMQGRVGIGRMSQAEMGAALARLSPTGALAALADADLVVEAVVENEKVKTDLFRQLQPIVKPGAILASNTSTISITRMAQAWSAPERFAGMHFFNPVDRMKLVEVIRGEKTNDETVVTLVALAKKIGKTPIVIKDCPGFLVNRILFPYINESLVLLEEGAGPRELDRAAVAYGMPMGPVTLNDLVGLDTALYAGTVVNTAYADRAKSTKILEELVKAGRMGTKSGAGFYAYAKGTKGLDDPALAGILARCRTGAQRTFTQEELTDLLFLPMLVEASRALMEGIVRDPGDVDMGLILGIGFPPFRGGILRWADTLGLDKVLEKLKPYEALGLRFQPTEQMRQLAKAKKGFYPE